MESPSSSLVSALLSERRPESRRLNMSLLSFCVADIIFFITPLIYQKKKVQHQTSCLSLSKRDDFYEVNTSETFILGLVFLVEVHSD